MIKGDKRSSDDPRSGNRLQNDGTSHVAVPLPTCTTTCLSYSFSAETSGLKLKHCTDEVCRKEKKRKVYAFQQSYREPPKAAARSYDHRP